MRGVEQPCTWVATLHSRQPNVKKQVELSPVLTCGRATTHVTGAWQHPAQEGSEQRKHLLVPAGTLLRMLQMGVVVV